MKITFYSVANVAFGGGYEKQILRLATSLKEAGNDVEILTSSITFTKKLAIILSFLYFTPRFSFPELDKAYKEVKKDTKVSLKEFSSVGELKKILEKSDLIYTKNEILDTVLLRFALKKKHPPVICGIHTLLYFPHPESIHSRLHNLIYLSPLYLLIINKFQGFHCIYKEQINVLKANLKNKKIYFIPNFIDNVSSIYSEEKKYFTILFVGRLSKQKGIDLFLEVIDRMSNETEFPMMKFVICGIGPYKKEIGKYTKKYKNVEYKGYLSSKKLSEVYSSASLFSITSRGETFSLSSIEAQQYGLPVVGFDIPGLRDIIYNGKDGFLVKMGDIESLTDKILEFYYLKTKNIKKYLFFANNAKKKVLTFYSKNVVLPKYTAMFREIGKQK